MKARVKATGRDSVMKKIAVITTSKELKEFQERTDIRILDINVKACDQTWATQEYFVATIVYDDNLNSEPDYWTRLEHTYVGMFMKSFLDNFDGTASMEQLVESAIDLAHTTIQKLKGKEKR